MDRVLRGTPATASVVFYEDGAAVDPGIVTVTITSEAGQTLTGGTASGTGTSARTLALDEATHTALLDNLTVSWASTTKGTLTTRIEVVGGFLFGIAEARAMTPLDNATNYPTSAIVAMRTTVEEALEQACGCAFVPRYTRQTINGSGSGSILLRPLVTALRSATVDGTAISASDITGLAYTPAGIVYSSSAIWTYGTSNVVVDYEHGYQSPPHEIKRAALMLAKMWLVGNRSPIDDRAATFNATEGGTYSLVVPGRNGSHFGHPDVDAAIDRYSLVSGIGIG